MKTQKLIYELNRRAARAVISTLGLRSESARSFLRNTFEQQAGQNGSFLSSPVFEATYGWQQCEEDICALSPDLFAPQVLEALAEPPDRPGASLQDHAFPLDRKPHIHQKIAWETLLAEEPRSALISAGTGSGKTECFLLPIIEDLYRRHLEEQRAFVGVRALFLYPLNALINSQKERLQAWTAGFDGNLRFCLYNGETPETAPNNVRRQTPEQVIDREVLRGNPPPILVTNATMLEYMLVRSVDAPIIDQSRGKLRWIVLDEAHTYVGSQSAELALLLRRVMVAFDVRPQDVRFVATSATIGSDDPEGEIKLRQFMADIAGVEMDQVSVIRGHRDVPRLPDADPRANVTFKHLQLAKNTERGDLLTNFEPARLIRQALADTPHARLSRDLVDLVRGAWPKVSHSNLWELMDLMAAADAGEGSFLPFRVHLFQKTLSGIFSCTNPNCSNRDFELSQGDWPFGQIYLSERDFCPCGAPVQPLYNCNHCGEEYLGASERFRDGSHSIEHPDIREGQGDEFIWGAEVYEEGGPEEQDNEQPPHALHATQVLLSSKETESSTPCRLQLNSRELLPEMGDIELYSVPLDVCQCLSCGARNHGSRPVFFPKRLGAPFFLGDALPTLLEHSPAQPGMSDRPHHGRRLLTFTDSRQGTARLAARLQQDIDRSKVRSIIYHELCSQTGGPQNPKRIAELESDISGLEATIAEVGEVPLLVQNLQAKKDLLDAEWRNYIPAQLSWQEALNALANSPDMERSRLASRLDSIHSNDFPHFCLLREFMRRPLRGYQLETLGMVEVLYPDVEALQQHPAAWSDICQDIGQIGPDQRLSDWKDWLTILIDTLLRGNTAVEIPNDWINLMGGRVPRKLIVSPDSEAAGGVIRWPDVRRSTRSKAVGFLRRAFELDLSRQAHVDLVDQVLRDSWTVLRDSILRPLDGARFRLILENRAALRRPAAAYRCPYSRQIVSRLFKGQSPNTPGFAAEYLEPQTVEIPVLPTELAHHRNGRQAIYDWLEDSTQLCELRELGLWPNRSDRIALGESWFRIEEHSAQLPATMLQQFERDFKDGQLNILSCSTTMEMGVDIGGMSAVAMNNVPPHPANYLQRAGRAGRRGEATSAAYTLCNSNANSMQVFANPFWPFETERIAAPKVSLDSRNIVQRHVNSFLLSVWLRTLEDEVLGLLSDWFMEGLEDGEPARAEEFLAWCNTMPAQDPTGAIAKGVEHIVRRTRLQGIGFAVLAGEAANQLEPIWRKWVNDLQVLEAELANIVNEAPVGLTEEQKEKLPAVRAINKNLRRMRKEYLLKDLISGGFLPGYGFPTNIVALNLTSIQSLQKNDAQEREDNLLKIMKGPSRGMAIALREYAPGAEVVINGRVYRSGGLTLNWHIPADANANSEPQNIRWHWQCGHCGEFGNDVRMPHHCSACGPGGNELNRVQVIEPAGFAVDFFSEPHTDVASPKYMPFEDPLVAAVGSVWLPLPNPELGSIRYSESGIVSFNNRGLHGHGYTLCLACGRAEPQQAKDEPNEAVAGPHLRLRGGGANDARSQCQGPDNPFLIKQAISLGGEDRTSVFDIQLRDARRNFEPVRETNIAWTVGYAIRNAVCARLGVNQREVEVAVRDRRFGDGMAGFVLSLYDTASQGAGFVEILRDELRDFMLDARQRLECPANCDSACQHCLLDGQTQFREAHLNRHTAIEWLDAWLAAIDLPDEYRFFEDSIPSITTLPYQLHLLSRSRRLNKVQLFVKSSELDTGVIADWPMYELSQSLIRTGVNVEWVVSGDDVASLVETFGGALSGLVALSGGLLHFSSLTVDEASVNGGHLMMCAYWDGGAYAWAAMDPELGMNEHWSECETPTVRSGRWDGLAEEPIPIGEDRLTLERPPGSLSVSVSNELDCNAWQFGGKFIEFSQAKFPQLGERLANPEDTIRRIAYSDRYLRSPLAVSLLYRLLRSILNGRGKDVPLEVSFEYFEPERLRWPRWPSHNFLDGTQCEQILSMLLRTLSEQVTVSPCERAQLIHQRRLTIEFIDGESYEVEFDQGMGAWGAKTNVPLPNTLDGLAEHMAGMKVPIRIHDSGTTINFRTIDS